MCVIAIVDKVRPTDEQVAKMFKHNDHGAGIAWREKGKGVVKWRKGLDLPTMQELVKTLPAPFIAHFRIASCGPKCFELCHPFPVGESASLALEGTTKGWVLFHNGHWGEWKNFTKESALKLGRGIPVGPWSDTRAMALAAHNYGVGILEMIDEKTVAFSPTEIEVTKGRDGWDEVDGVWYSNKRWTFASVGRGSGFFSRGVRDTSDNDNYYKQIPASLPGGEQCSFSSIENTRCTWQKGHTGPCSFQAKELCQYWLNNTRCTLPKGHRGVCNYSKTFCNWARSGVCCTYDLNHVGLHSYEAKTEQCDVTLNGKIKCRLDKGHTGGHNYTEAPGGGLSELPFDLIEQIWKDQQILPRSEWMLSKKQYNRLKRKFEISLKKLGIPTPRATTPMVVVH